MAKDESKKRKRPPLSTQKKLIFTAFFFAALFLFVELGAQFTYRFFGAERKWPIVAWWQDLGQMFERHPFLVGVPKPNAVIERFGIRITHNEHGRRGPDEVIDLSTNVYRIATFGGSSTYCTGVEDKNTWPNFLNQMMGDGVSVHNFGVPGYTTTENLIQTALLASEVKPHLAIYYEGYNDARTQHVLGLRPDYSHYHGPSQIPTLRLNQTVPILATVKLYRGVVYRLRKSMNAPVVKPPAKRSAGTRAVDEIAMSIYRRNLEQIVALCHAQGIRVMFVPQQVSDGDLPAAENLPHTRAQDINFIMDAHNATMKEVANEQGVYFAGRVEAAKFTEKDFFDWVHMTAEANERLAGLLKAEIEDLRSASSNR